MQQLHIKLYWLVWSFFGIVMLNKGLAVKRNAAPIPIHFNYSFKVPIDIEFTPENFAKALILLKVNHPEIVYAQALYESDFKSSAWRDLNNPFGMNFPRQRETTAIGNRNKLARYKHWIHSIMDYKLFQENRMINCKSKQAYYLRLDKIYCTSKQYSKKLKRLLTQRKIHDFFKKIQKT